MAHLLTHEDARFFRVHALCGLYCLLHFLYRLFLWLRYRSFLFDGSLTTPLSLAPHALLAFSALQFRLPLKRNPLAPMLNPEVRSRDFTSSAYAFAREMHVCVRLGAARSTGLLTNFVWEARGNGCPSSRGPLKSPKIRHYPVDSARRVQR